MGRSLLYQTEDFNKFTTEDSLQSSFLQSSSYYKGTHELKICNSSYEYQENSIESAALSSVASLDKAFTFYQSLENHISTSKVHLVSKL